MFADPSGLDFDPNSYGTPPKNPQDGDLWQNDKGVTYQFNGTSWDVHIPQTEEKLSLQRNQYFPVQKDNGEFRTAPEQSLGNFGNKWHAYNQTEPTNSNALWIGLSKLTYSFTDDAYIFLQIKQLGEGNLNHGVIKHLNGVKATPQEIGVLLLSYGLAVVGGEFLAAEAKPTFNMIEYAAAESSTKSSVSLTEETAKRTSTQVAEDVAVNKSEQVLEKSYSVYIGFDETGTRYVGITSRNPQIRFYEHYSDFGTGKELLRYDVLDYATNLTKIDARIMEQNIINQFGLSKNGGSLLNKINSLSPKYWGNYGILP